jgi:hypothetical protein
MALVLALKCSLLLTSSTSLQTRDGSMASMDHTDIGPSGRYVRSADHSNLEIRTSRKSSLNRRLSLRAFYSLAPVLVLCVSSSWRQHRFESSATIQAFEDLS